MEPISQITAPARQAIAFTVAGQRLAAGTLPEVALKVKAALEAAPEQPVLVFDARSSEPIDLDLRGDAAAVVARLAPLAPPDAVDAPRGRGRPKLGVTAREVTLLPRHWDWLNAQPGGASVALRKLVETASRASEAHDHARQARDAAYRFMSAMAGNLPHFEEAARALYAADREGFARRIAGWPADIRAHAAALADDAFASTPHAHSAKGRHHE